MITVGELNPRRFKMSTDESSRLEQLCQKMNVVRKAWGRPMIVTSGFRSIEDHKRIYAEKLKKLQEKDPTIKSIRVPMGSKHLTAQAVDISDPRGELYRWCKANDAILVEAGLYCEEDTSVPRVHFQSVPPASGKRWFLP